MTPPKSLPATLQERMALIGIADRRRIVHSFAPIRSGKGLEIAPLWAPLVTKDEGNILYTDYLDYETLLEREKDNQTRIDFGLEVQPIDFLWPTGHTLKSSAPDGAIFDYVISSHVLEHVPDFLGYIYQMREVLSDKGVIIFVLPDILGSGEHFRRPSSVAEIIDAYLTGSARPTPRQVYDGFRHYFRFDESVIKGRPFPIDMADTKLDDLPLDFPPEKAFEIAKQSLIKYTDVHCWSFSKQSFPAAASELKQIGAFDFDIVETFGSPPMIGQNGSEFYVVLKPTAPPRKIARATPANQNQSISDHILNQYESRIGELEAAVQHGNKAFREAMEVIELLKREKAAAELHGAKAFADAVKIQEKLKLELVASRAHGETAFKEAVTVQEKLKAHIRELEKTILHANKAFAEAVAVQNSLKAETDAVRKHGESAFREAIAAQNALKDDILNLKQRIAQLTPVSEEPVDK